MPLRRLAGLGLRGDSVCSVVCLLTISLSLRVAVAVAVVVSGCVRAAAGVVCYVDANGRARRHFDTDRAGARVYAQRYLAAVVGRGYGPGASDV